MGPGSHKLTADDFGKFERKTNIKDYQGITVDLVKVIMAWWLGDTQSVLKGVMSYYL